MEIVNIHEAKTRLSALIQKMLKGEKIIIAKNNKPIAELVKYNTAGKKRGMGMLKGKIWISGDCWDPDPEIERSFYESELFPDEDLA